MPDIQSFRFKTILIIAAIFSQISSLSAANDTIVAVVNEEVITLNELKDYINALAVQLKAQGRNLEEIKSMLGELESHGLEQLIDDRLVVTEANKKGVEINEKAVDDRLNDIKKNYATEQEFLRSLLDMGITVTDLRNKIKDQLKINFLAEEEVRSKIFVNPQEVTDYYNTHLEAYRKPPGVELDSIFVSSGQEPQNAKAKAEGALALLSDGKVFSDVAKEYSDTPNVGFIRKGQLLPAIEDEVFKLKENEVSGIVEAENGFYIFQVKKILPPEMASLENVKDEITDLLFRQKYQKKLRVWLDKLKQSAYIEVKE